jgi:hypothetical protein
MADRERGKASSRDRQDRRLFQRAAAPKVQVERPDALIGGEIPREASTTLDDRCPGAGGPPGDPVIRPVVSPVQVLETRQGPFRGPGALASSGRGRCRPHTTPGDERGELSRPVTTPGDDPALLLVRFRNKRRPRGWHLLRSESAWVQSMDLLQALDNPRPVSPRLLGAPGAPPSDPDGSPGARRGQNSTFDVGTRSSVGRRIRVLPVIYRALRRRVGSRCGPCRPGTPRAERSWFRYARQHFSTPTGREPMPASADGVRPRNPAGRERCVTRCPPTAREPSWSRCFVFPPCSAWQTRSAWSPLQISGP